MLLRVSGNLLPHVATLAKVFASMLSLGICIWGNISQGIREFASSLEYLLPCGNGLKTSIEGIMCPSFLVFWSSKDTISAFVNCQCPNKLN